MAVTVAIAGTNRAIKSGSLRINDVINARSTASMVVESDTYAPAIGDAVIITEDGVTTFGGFIETPKQQPFPGSSGIIRHDLSLVDNHRIADRRVMNEIYTNQNAGAIVNDIITNYLAAEGVTAGTIQDGPVIVKAVFPYMTIAAALDELSEVTGLQWVIRHDKTLDFFERGAFTAPWDFDSTNKSKVIGQPKLKHDRKQYRNRQYIRGGQDTSDSQTETFKGDGSKRTFGPLAMSVAEKPSDISVNSVAIASGDIGIYQLESGKKWYWNKGKDVFVQDESETVLATTDAVAITYKGLFPILVQVDDMDEQLTRKAAEGGTGIYEDVERMSQMEDSDAAQQYGEGKLRRYGSVDKVLTYNTFETDLEVGMLQTCNITELDINEDLLITRISSTDVRRADGKLLRSVELLSGEGVGGWQAFFKKLIQTGKDFAIREDEVLIYAKRVETSKITCGESLTYTTGAPVTAVGTATVGFSEVAS